LLAVFHVSALTLQSSTHVKVDAGSVLCEMGEHQARLLLSGLAGTPGHRDENALARGVPAWAREIAYREKVEFPDLKQEVLEFIEAIGGMEGFGQWHALARLKERRDREFVWKADALTQVSNATFSPYEASGSETLCDLRCDSYGDAEAILRSQEYVRPHGEEQPPFAWATTTLVWEGVTPEQVTDLFLDLAADDEEVTAANLAADLLQDLETQLDDEHHEDAKEQIVDPKGLEAIAEKWLPLRKSPEGGAVLARLCAEWNAKQDIVSYLVDRSRIVGLRSDVSKDDCIDYARRQAMAKALAANEVHGLWREPFRGNRGELERKLEEQGVHIAPEPFGHGWTLWKGDRKETFPTFELAAERVQPAGAQP